MNATQNQIKVRKVYTFGKFHDAEVYTYYGTSRCKVIRFDPVGQYQPVEEWTNDYNTAHGIAKLHALQMNAKYN
jgi:hypothetical protein